MTTKQKQCLLEYLGYYSPENSATVNNVDGILGDKTQEATRKFQGDYGLVPDGIFGPLTEAEVLDVVATGRTPGVNWDSVKYFTKSEFQCKCNGKYCNGFPAEPKPALVKTADKIRNHFGKPAIVSSGVRCETHNKNVGGVVNSRHLFGKAMDFYIVGETAKTVLAYVQSLPEVRYAYCIDENYVHIDID